MGEMFDMSWGHQFGFGRKAIEKRGREKDTKTANFHHLAFNYAGFCIKLALAIVSKSKIIFLCLIFKTIGLLNVLLVQSI